MYIDRKTGRRGRRGGAVAFLRRPPAAPRRGLAAAWPRGGISLSLSLYIYLSLSLYIYIYIYMYQYTYYYVDIIYLKYL